MVENPDDKITMMVDIENARVGCINIQAAFACSGSDFVMQLPVEFWTTSSQGLKKYSLTRQQAQDYVNRLKQSKEPV